MYVGHIGGNNYCVKLCETDELATAFLMFHPSAAVVILLSLYQPSGMQMMSQSPSLGKDK